MTDHPLPLKPWEVRAILRPDAPKTMLRRPLKPQPRGHTAWQDEDTGEWWVSGHGEVGDTLIRPARWTIGDTLWVRETFALVGTTDPGWLLYRASGYEAECARHGFDAPYPSESKVRWRSSTQMPRWASRISLRVTGLRVERVQEISEEDARAEGVEPGLAEEADTYLYSYREGFRNVWEGIYGPDAWEKNWWVSVTTFERIEG